MVKRTSKKKALSRKNKKTLRKAPRSRIKKKAAPKRRNPVSRKKIRKKTAPKKDVKKKKPKITKKADVKLESAPKAPTPEQVEDMKKITTILGDAYIRQTLIEVGGENALAIVRNFYSNHSDEELAKKLKIKISDVRATLNKLHNEGLVNYIRQKDNETGWYSYSWSLNHGRMEKWANDQNDKLSGMGDGNGDNYYCRSCGTSTITSFEDAASGEFKCCHCNRMLDFLDKTKMREMFERKRL